ncbi:MAG: ATP-binding protein [Pyrinomonadaceae bacterium]|nr:ATP-binding protein [Pyrinomonadaceae bacterium]
MPSTKRVVPVENKRLDAMAKKTDNITEPKRAKEGLRTSEIRYRRLFEAARDGILILNAHTLKIIDVNPFMSELLGYSRDEFVGKELWEIGFFRDKKASQDAFREVQAKGYLRYEDLPLQTKEGKVQDVEFVSNVYEEDGHQVIQCNIREINERRRVEEERSHLLESAQAARAEANTANTIKDEFLAIVSHELRAPLNSILGWSELLTTGDLDDEASKHALEVIVRNARAQRQLIDDLLDISRIITGKLRLDVRPVKLAPMIEAVIDGMRPAAEARNIHLVTALDSLTSPVSGDPERLQQIIWNLLSNAIKFTPKGGTVVVHLKRVHSQIEIVISDTGQGIAPEFLDHVFERFRQSDSSSTRRHGGLGLGLSIVRQLVELHGGTVMADSPGEGEGTTFKVLLPVLSVHHELNDLDMTHTLIGIKTLTDRQPSLADLRVLVVDDEPDGRELIAAVMVGRGAEVVSVGSGAEALEEMERQQFDVLISDIGMPLMDGYTLIEKVRQLSEEHGGRTPAAALTAYAGVEDRMRALSAGYQMHIPKPVEPSRLTTVVASLAGRYSKPRAI